jgi:hypothetical protein
MTGDDLLWAMATLGFQDYIEPLKLYLHNYREVRAYSVDVWVNYRNCFLVWVHFNSSMRLYPFGMDGILVLVSHQF